MSEPKEPRTAEEWSKWITQQIDLESELPRHKRRGSLQIEREAIRRAQEQAKPSLCPKHQDELKIHMDCCLVCRIQEQARKDAIIECAELFDSGRFFSSVEMADKEIIRKILTLLEKK